MTATQKTCFVIMGFGEKIDYETGRKLDLNKTYNSILKPAAEAAGLVCVRADEVQHSGVIDLPMYEQLFAADVVVADLSTGNNNAFYELGVRHALRPFSTIAVCEKEFKLPFDVNHVAVRRYEHLGKGIDFDEVTRVRAELAALIRAILNAPKQDSPVYTFLPALDPPRLQPALPGAGGKSSVPPGPSTGSVGVLRNAIEQAKGNGDWQQAKAVLASLALMTPGEPWVIQQLGLATYKLGDGRKKSALGDARALYLEASTYLAQLQPSITADAETLGLWGAVFKRLFELEEDVAPALRLDAELTRASYLDDAIEALQKGFLILNDYYNGINLAYLLDVRSDRSTGDDALADRVQASRARRRVIQLCEAQLSDNKVVDADRYWVLASLEEAFFGLRDEAGVTKYHAKALEAATQPWMRQTTDAQLAKLGRLLERRDAAGRGTP